MIYFIELWNAKAKWLALSERERAAYVENVAQATEGLVAQGVEVLTWSINTDDSAHKGPYDYFAIWSFPDEVLANEFLSAVENAGWYNYFEQINIKGKVSTAEVVLNGLVTA